MFKRITIQLTEPICNCEEQKISWTPKLATVTKDSKTYNAYTLDLWCEICETRLSVSNDKFRAAFEFDKPYPGKKDAPKPALKPKLELLDGGAKVIPFSIKDEVQNNAETGEQGK